MSTGPDPSVWTSLVELASRLSTDVRPEEGLQLIVETTRDLLQADGACLHTAERGPVAVAPTELAELAALDELQHSAGSAGPGAEAFATTTTVTVAEIDEHQQRWPSYVRATQDVGIHAVAAFPVTRDEGTLGVLSTYVALPHRWASDERGLGELLAALAGAHLASCSRLLHREDEVSQLQHALTSRVLIEQAKGVLAASEDITVDQAFERIRGLARRRNLTVQEVAEAVLRFGLRPPSAVDARRSDP